jgi:putative transposase
VSRRNNEIKSVIWLTIVCIALVVWFCLRRRTNAKTRGFWADRRSLQPCAAEIELRPTKLQTKPAWVVTEVLRLIAIMRGKGCRTIAANFNAAFAGQGVSVSKSYVANLRKKSRYQIIQLRRELRKPPRAQKPNQTWGIDFTDVHIDSNAHTLIGVIDYGSRLELALQLTQKSATAVLDLIKGLIVTFGKPKRIKTDNDGAFVSAEFRAGMKKLGIYHQHTRPFSPWENGRIERFFGNFKAALRKITMICEADLIQAAHEFRIYYNHIRLHQNIGYRKRWDIQCAKRSWRTGCPGLLNK